jgi:hypothetical protein
MKAIKSVTATQDIVDLKGWTVKKGTVVHVMKVCPKHPIHGYRLLLVRIDNGTGSFNLMPETVVKDSDLGLTFKETVA